MLRSLACHRVRCSPRKCRNPTTNRSTSNRRCSSNLGNRKARRTTRAKTQSRSMPPSSRSAWKERRKSAAATARLVKSGVLSKVEAEQRALRVVRLESELAKAQMISAQQQLTSLKARFLAGQVSQPEVDAATTALTQATV